jgi:hypothetical protein
VDTVGFGQVARQEILLERFLLFSSVDVGPDADGQTGMKLKGIIWKVDININSN